MAVEVNCSACRRRLDIAEHLLGRPITCPDCGTTFSAQADPLSQEADPVLLAARRRSQAAGKFALILAGLLVVGGGGFLVYWYFIADHTPARPAAELAGLRYLPASCYLVAGVDVQNALEVPELAACLNRQLLGPGKTVLPDALQHTLGLELNDLDHFVFGINDNRPVDGWRRQRRAAEKNTGPPTRTLVLKTRQPYDRQRILTRAQAGPPQTQQGTPYYPLPGNKDFSVLYFPTDQIIVLADVPAGRLGAVLAPVRLKPSLSYDLMDVLKRIGKAHAWVAATREPGRVAGLAPGLAPLLLARGFGLWIKAQGDKADVGAGVICRSPATAQGLMVELASGRTGLQTAVRSAIGVRNRELATEVLDNLRYYHKASFAWAVTRVRLSSLQPLLDSGLGRAKP